MDLFWELDAGGRCRVLSKFISRFAKVDLIATRFIPLTAEKAKRPEDMDEIRESLLYMLSDLRSLWDGNIWSMGLLIQDNFETGPIYLEPMASSQLAGIDEIILHENNGDLDKPDINVWELPEIELDEDEDEEFDSDNAAIFTVFLPPAIMRVASIHHPNSSGWSDPARTRGVIREVLDLM